MAERVIDIPNTADLTSVEYVVAATAGGVSGTYGARMNVTSDWFGKGAVISGTLTPNQLGGNTQVTLIAGRRGSLSTGTGPEAGGAGYGNGGSGGTDYSGDTSGVSGGVGGGGGSALLLGSFTGTGHAVTPIVIAGVGGGAYALGGQAGTTVSNPVSAQSDYCRPGGTASRMRTAILRRRPWSAPSEKRAT
ncbi:hypothetical protein [Brevibacterium senegalense]|uniref:hypothetical protein n=1 Tax=Brevibacterium senegalense TaxID=1033736 RepID=UPI001C54CA42|nr:hypothetical protein [Brevibacterium senegalense]